MNLSPEAKALYEKLKKHNPAVLEKLREEHMEQFKFRKQVRAAAGLYGKLPLQEESSDSLIDAVRKRAKVLMRIN